MRRISRRPTLWLVFGLFGVVLSGCPEGSTEADADISSGKLKIKTYGLQGDADKEYAVLLKERCNVEVEYVPGELKPEEKKQIDRYNKRMKQEIKKKHGEDILDNLFKEALVKAEVKKEQDKK